MGERGPKPPLAGKALEFAQDCATLSRAKPDLSDLDRPTYRGLARRWAIRTSFPLSWGRDPVPANVHSELASIARFMRREIIRRIAHPGGFVAIDNKRQQEVAVELYERELRSKQGEQRLNSESVSPFSFHAAGQTERGQALPVRPGPAWRSSDEALAIHAILKDARYWPFRLCENEACQLLFVPKSRKARYCREECRKAQFHRQKSDPRKEEGRGYRRKASETARRHQTLRSSGDWKRQRAPGAGRPRKEKP